MSDVVSERQPNYERAPTKRSEPLAMRSNDLAERVDGKERTEFPERVGQDGEHRSM
jgi:hypothetical protein